MILIYYYLRMISDIMNDNYKPLSLFIQDKHIQDKQLLANIAVKVKDDMYLYNYNSKFSVPRDHPILVKCRGLILNKNGEVLNYPFDRFFNDFEKEASSIYWDGVKLIEKLDGSLICVFYYQDKWHITTRGSFYPNPSSDIDYSELFKQQFNNFNRLNKGLCYMFELITKQNRIITWYDYETVYLIGARNLSDLTELNQDELNIEANSIKVKRPKIYDVEFSGESEAYFATLKDDEEGFVVVDKKFNRVKLKQDTYIKLAKIKQLKPQNLFNVILGVETIDIEYLIKCPEVMEEMDKMLVVWLSKLEIVTNIFNNLNQTDRKAFAFEAIKYDFKSILFCMLDGKAVTRLNLKWAEILNW